MYKKRTLQNMSTFFFNSIVFFVLFVPLSAAKSYIDKVFECFCFRESRVLSYIPITPSSVVPVVSCNNSSDAYSKL